MNFDKIKEIIADTTGCDEELITMEASLEDDLGMDSLDAVELSMALEETFDISIEEEKLVQFKSVEDIVNYIDSVTN